MTKAPIEIRDAGLVRIFKDDIKDVELARHFVNMLQETMKEIKIVMEDEQVLFMTKKRRRVFCKLKARYHNHHLIYAEFVVPYFHMDDKVLEAYTNKGDFWWICRRFDSDEEIVHMLPYFRSGEETVNHLLRR